MSSVSWTSVASKRLQEPSTRQRSRSTPHQGSLSRLIQLDQEGSSGCLRHQLGRRGPQVWLQQIQACIERSGREQHLRNEELTDFESSTHLLHGREEAVPQDVSRGHPVVEKPDRDLGSLSLTTLNHGLLEIGIQTHQLTLQFAVAGL